MNLQEARQAVGKQGRSNVRDGDYYPLAGGLNVVDTPLQIAPGELIDCLNYEPRTLGGYARLTGYERYDGHVLPSQAPYWILNFNGGTPANYPSVNSFINDGTTSMQVLLVVLNNPNTTGYIVCGETTATSGIGGIGVNLRNGSTLGSGSIFGVAIAAATLNGFAGQALGVTYSQLATLAMTAIIQPVPGSGPIRGVFQYKGKVYAFRDNNGATAKNLYVATATGWTQVVLNPIILFFAGSASGITPAAGDTIHGSTSGAVNTLCRVVLQSGSWAAGTAKGYFILSTSGTGSFSAAEIITDTSQGAATLCECQTNQSNQTLAAGGQYDLTIQNFFGSSGTLAVYGADGVNHGFEFCDTPSLYYCQIASGMPVDTPQYVSAHRGRLWLAFPNGSLQPSSVNDPITFSALQGAAEIGVGYNITGLLGEMSPSQSAFYSTATLFVFTTTKTFTITGDGPNWILGPFSADDAGAAAFSVQRISQGIFLNARGFYNLQSVQQLGNFNSATISQKIQSLVAGLYALAACSSVSRAKSLYRLFLSDGRMISIGFKDLKTTGITICNLQNAFSCAFSAVTAAGDANFAAGQENCWIGNATNGQVSLMDSGNALDGAQLRAFIHTAFHFSKSPSRQKRYRRVALDMIANGTATIYFAPDYSYGSTKVGSDAPRTLQSTGVLPNPGVDPMTRAAFSWTNGQVAHPTFKLEGSGNNIGIVVYHESSNEPAHILQGVTLHESLRRLDRGSQG